MTQQEMSQPNITVWVVKNDYDSEREFTNYQEAMTYAKERIDFWYNHYEQANYPFPKIPMSVKLEQLQEETKISKYSASYFTHLGYTDRSPYEIVNVISEKTIEIRAMDSERDDWDMQIMKGGFSAIVLNQRDQKWKITSNENNPVIRIRKHKNGQWKNKYGAKYIPSDAPYKFYDYNF